MRTVRVLMGRATLPPGMPRFALILALALCLTSSAAASTESHSLAWARATASNDVIDFLHKGYALSFAGSGIPSQYVCTRLGRGFRCMGLYTYRTTRARLTIDFVANPSVVDTRVQVRRCLGPVCPLRRWRSDGNIWRSVA
jgi:hypothetical protein